MSKQTDPEIWRVIPSPPDHLASTHGRIMKIPYYGQMPHGGPKSYGGYPKIGSWDGARYIHAIKGGGTYKVARLVCEAFHGPAPAENLVCMHLDENSRNNRPENLRWGTQKENLNAPGYAEKISRRGGADLRKTTKEQRLEIAARYSAGESQAKLAKEYGISACRVSAICKALLAAQTTTNQRAA